MAIMLDVLRKNAFSAVEFHEELVEKIDFRPEILGTLNLFKPIYSRTPKIGLVHKSSTLKLIPITADGSPPVELIPEGADLREFEVSRLAKGSTIYAASLAGVLNLPSDETFKEVVEEAAERSAHILSELELTWEHMRLGAVHGVVYDADGSSVIYDWYQEWGITPPEEINFELDKPDTDVRKKCRDLSRAMQKAAKGVWRPETSIGALVSDEFYDLLLNHPQIKETKIGTEAADKLENLTGYSHIVIENIKFINYRGTEDGKLSIDAEKARFFPINADGAFQVGWGPMNESKHYVNQRGQEKYTLFLEDNSGRDAWDRIEIYSFPLFICTRPEMLMKGRAK